MMIVEPVIMRPLTAEWEAVKAELTEILSRNRNRDGTPGTAALSRAEARLDTFLKRLADVRILDPACGSGNFLYLALQSLKDFEHRAIVEAPRLGLALRVIHCGPHNVKGIEINPYAAELARTSIWIGNIQWLRRNGFEARKEPVLEDLDAIECRDALVTMTTAHGSYDGAGADGRTRLAKRCRRSEWPTRVHCRQSAVSWRSRAQRTWAMSMSGVVCRLRSERVPREADLVLYWFEKARAALELGKTSRVGFVATNSIRGGANRRMLDRILSKASDF